MRPARLRVRQTTPDDIPGIVALSTRIYGPDGAWSPAQLHSHLEHFAEGQFVAVRHGESGEQLIGMAASLILYWDDYQFEGAWRDFTARGTFSNHDPVNGRTLYGAEVMADPDSRGQGVGTALYNARRRLVQRRGLLRVRAGARLRGYHRVADQMTAEAYASEVVRGTRRDPTLSFQLARGFAVIGVVGNYLGYDPESLGWAAIIEWLNPAVAVEADHELQRAWLRRSEK